MKRLVTELQINLTILQDVYKMTQYYRHGRPRVWVID
jgi:hypothetical protein